MRTWKENKDNECLLVNGARRVGKTFSIRQFEKEGCQNFVEINFWENPLIISVFDNALDSGTIVRQLSLRIPGFKPVGGSTLIFLDEIQQCTKARTALKFLSTDYWVDVVASGSLITLMSQDVPSLPVGYEREGMMYPLCFEEYLWARGYGENATTIMKSAFSDLSILDKDLVFLYTSLLNEYMMIGGMPAAMNAYLESTSWNDVRAAQNNILRFNLLNMEKYSNGLDRERIRLAFDGVVRQTGEGRKAFSFAQIERSRSRARDYLPVVAWLEKAQLVYSFSSLSHVEFHSRCIRKQAQKDFICMISGCSSVLWQETTICFAI